MSRNKPILPSLTWDIKETGILLATDSSPIDGYKCLVRNDNSHKIAVVKSSYSPFTNGSFVETMQRISKITGMPIEGYQDFNGSRKVLGYLKNTDKNFKVCGSPMKDYMVLGNSHDVSSPIFFGTSNDLARCTNQWSKILRAARIRHTSNKQQKIEAILVDMEQYFKERKLMYENLERFGEIKISRSVVRELVAELMEVEDATNISQRKKNQIDDLMDSIDTEMRDLGNNMWGLFNGVTHYTTHKVNPKNGNVMGNTFGKQGQFNNDVYEFGVKLIKERPALVAV